MPVGGVHWGSSGSAVLLAGAVGLEVGRVVLMMGMAAAASTAAGGRVSAPGVDGGESEGGVKVRMMVCVDCLVLSV